MNTKVASKTILLVEDNPDDEILTLRGLRKNDIANRVEVVRDGAEALDYLFSTGKYAGRSAKALPDLVLLDLKLPKLDGLEVLRRLRAENHTRLLPVVVLTTSKEPLDLDKAYRLGANSYIRKPVNFAEFTEVVGYLGLYWLALNEPPPDPGDERETKPRCINS